MMEIKIKIRIKIKIKNRKPPPKNSDMQPIKILGRHIRLCQAGGMLVCLPADMLWES